tara:strand:- start:380 stop:1627 length:1248 start_codon:yes stop_codon:yes gene_type:complete
LKILIVTQYFWPETFRINDLAVSLTNRGNQVTVLTGIPNYPKGKFFYGYSWFNKVFENYQGVEIIRVPIFPRGDSSKLRLILNYLSYLVSASILGPLFCRKKFDIILVFQLSPVTSALPAIFLKKLKNASLFLWVQDLWPDSVDAVGAINSKSKIFFLIGKLVGFIYSKSDRILIQSKAFENSIKEYVGKNKKIHYFPNTAEKIYKPISNNKKLPEYNTLPKGFIVMFAGNIGVAQDFATILKTADIIKNKKRLPEIKWVILGDGSEKNRIEKNILQANLSDVFYLLGEFPIEKMPIFFSLADVLLVTLKKDPVFKLTIPSKIPSYMACAKPIIASIQGEGAKLISESGAGITCDSEDPNALALALLEIYEMPYKKRGNMGKSGRKYFLENLDGDMLISRLENWMIDEIKNKQPL